MEALLVTQQSQLGQILKNEAELPEDNDSHLEIKFETPELSGDNFTSRCEYATICLSENPEDSLELFVKRRLVNQKELAKEMEAMGVFEREALFFRCVLPELLEFCMSNCGYSDFIQRMIPKCYYADPQLVALENLAKTGYKLCGKTNHHSLEQARIVARNFAKLHGVSYAFIETVGLKQITSCYPELTRANIWGEESKAFRGIFVQAAIDGAIKILKEFPTPGSEEALAHYEQYKSDAYGKVTRYFDLDTPSCAIVLNHGDCWNCNTMWKMGTGGPTECVFVDWQAVHLGSPVLDWGYYLFFTVDPDVVSKHWKDILRYYYDGLRSYAGMLGVDVKFSYKNFVQDFQQKCEHGFAFETFKIVLMDGLEGMPSIDSVEAEVIDHLRSTFQAAVEKVISQRGQQTSVELVRAWQRHMAIISAEI